MVAAPTDRSSGDVPGEHKDLDPPHFVQEITGTKPSVQFEGPALLGDRHGLATEKSRPRARGLLAASQNTGRVIPALPNGPTRLVITVAVTRTV